MPALEGWGTTDQGLVRQNNEDTWYLDCGLRLAIVADGMGGASCGEVASALTVDTMVACLRDGASDRPAAEMLEDAIREANRRVLDKAAREKACSGMGSTVVAAFWNLPDVVIANVGDSRAYLLHGGELKQLSYDQTLVNELRLRFGLSEQEVSNFPHRNVLTMAVGTSPELRIRTYAGRFEAGDRLLLCSDGLSGPVSDAVILEILSSEARPRAQVEQLIAAAKAGGGPDNITAIVLHYGG